MQFGRSIVVIKIYLIEILIRIENKVCGITGVFGKLSKEKVEKLMNLAMDSYQYRGPEIWFRNFTNSGIS